jgi:cytochrome c553
MKTAFQLRQWLAKEILGRNLRKPPQRASLLHGGPLRDESYKAWIRTLPCCACGHPAPSEAAHTGRDGGMRQKASDDSCIPLCADCHTLAPDSYHRLGRARFARRHGLDLAGLAGELKQLHAGAKISKIMAK